MNCPKCGNLCSTREGEGPAGFYCKKCGWGKEGLSPAPSDSPLSVGLFIKLGLLWALSVVIVVGPYLLFLYGIPELVTSITQGHAEMDPEKVRDALTPRYLWGMAIYLLLGVAFSPRYDPGKLGLFGNVFLDNPFSYEDDFNRTMLALSLLLAPAKIVWATLRSTWRLFFYVLFRR